MWSREIRAVAAYASGILRPLVFLGLAVVVWKVAPVYASALRFHLALSQACRTAATGRHGPEQVRSDILFKARQLDLPIRPHQVEVWVQPRLVSAIVAYEVQVELGIRRLVLNFRPTAQERPLISFEGGEEHFERIGE